MDRPRSLEDQLVAALMEEEKDVIGDLTKSRNVPLAEIKHMALETVMSATSRADVTGGFSEREMKNDFFNRLRRSQNNVADPKYILQNPAPK